MALVRLFYEHRSAAGGWESYSLARDVTTDHVFVLQCRMHDGASGLTDEEFEIDLGPFLSRTGAPQQELLQLIGSLVIEF